MKNIAVFFGGVTCEHDISILTGVFVLNSLDKAVYNPIAIYIHNDGKFYTGSKLFDINFYKNFDLKKLREVTFLFGENKLYYIKNNKLKFVSKIDCGVNALHGNFGEDGSLYAILKSYQIPLVGSDMFSSSLAMDKYKTKSMIKDIPQAEYLKVNRREFFLDFQKSLDNIQAKLIFPVIVKPCTLGSSIGIKKASDNLELKQAIIDAFMYDNNIIIEKYLSGFFDINCAVANLGDEILVSQLEKPKTMGEILSFSDKYLGQKQGVFRQFPARIDTLVSQKIQQYSKKIYLDYGFSGVIRIDYLVKDGEIYLNEINSVPGSFAYYLFVDTVGEFSAMLSKLIGVAIREYSDIKSNKNTFSSSVLSISYQGAKK